jgi:hypothetical protein
MNSPERDFKKYQLLGELQKEKVAISDNFSCRVVPPGIEPEFKV